MNRKSKVDPIKSAKPLKKGGSRFVLPEVHQEVVSKHAQQLEAKQLKKQREKEDRDKLAQRVQTEISTYSNIASVYGMGILEAALKGETSYSLDDVTSPKLSIESVFRDRGFDVYKHEIVCSVDDLDDEMREQYFEYHPSVSEKINTHFLDEERKKEFRTHLLNQLFLIKRLVKTHSELNVDASKHFEYLQAINSIFLDTHFFQDNSLELLVELASEISKIPYHYEAGAIKDIVAATSEMSRDIEAIGPDNFEVSIFDIDWERFNLSDNLTSDCLEAPFLNWLSSKHGKFFIKEIFTKIEEANLRGKNSITFLAKLTQIREYFWVDNEDNFDDDDQSRNDDEVLIPGLRIFNSIISFDPSYLASMFSILGYSIELNKEPNGDVTFNICWE